MWFSFRNHNFVESSVWTFFLPLLLFLPSSSWTVSYSKICKFFVQFYSRGASTTSHHHHQHHRRPPNTAELHAAIKIRNLPIRSSDTSLKDGLYHAYKKHGKVAWVRVIGSGTDRYAIVCFKSQEYAAKAVQSSQDKQFFGCKIQVTPYYTGKSEESVGGTDEESRFVVLYVVEQKKTLLLLLLCCFL